jgi:hypothetical protein
MAKRERGESKATRTAIKLREKKQKHPRHFCHVNLPGELHVDLESYRRLYAEVHGQEIGLTELIIAIITQFLGTDHEFQRWKRKAQDPSTPAAE